MEAWDSNLSPLRAVLLSGDPLVGARLERLCARGWRAVRVASGYEAAAEILASPVAALLIDLRAMGDIHRRLLELAERMEVETFALADGAQGTARPGLEPLRRVELADIPAILAALAAREAREPAAAQTQPSAESPVTSPDAVGDELAGSLAAEKRVVLTPKSRRPKTRQALLTPEELAALLEDEQ